jgi:choline-sulfatase
MRARGRSRRLVATGLVAFAGVLAAAVWLTRPARDPQGTIRRLWAVRDVERPSFVLITLDTTRADRLGCYGYPHATTPHIDALARRGVLFEQAASPSPLTLPAHASILTGTYPTFHGVRINGNAALGRAHLTLAEALSEQGYQTAAFVAAFVLDGRWGLDQGFDLYDDRFDLRGRKHLDLAAVQRPGNEVMDAALEWLERHEREPFFAWIHLYDPHTPYAPPEPFLSAHAPRGPTGLYDGEIAFADQQVGRLVSWLEASGVGARTVVVVMADHGEGLGSHGEGTHGYFAYDYALRVPLIVATPFEKLHGVRVASQVSAVDVFPTVLALAGIAPAPAVHGRSLLGLMLQPGAGAATYAYGESMAPHLQYGWSPLHALRSERYKLIKAPRPELYDVAADPHEATNVIARHPEVAERMRNELERLIERTSRDAPATEAADLDKQTVAALAALGYMGGTATPASTGPLADPKDKLQVFANVQLAGELILEDRHADAAAALEAALQEEPGMPQARLMLGTTYSELGRKREAQAQFDRVLQDDPQSVQALIGMANLLLEQGRSEDVIALGKRTLALDERNTQAYALVGEAYVRQGRPADALPYFERAVEAQPKLTQNRLDLAACAIELGQYARAEGLLRQILQEYPRFPLAHFNLGLLYDEQGRLEEARGAYAAEVAAYPRQFKARFNLGKVLFRLGRNAASLDEMREVVRIAPERAEGHLFLGRGLLHAAAPLDEVQAPVERGLALAETPETKAFGLLLLADVMNRRGRPQDAAAALDAVDAQMGARARGSRHAEHED